MSSRLSVVRAVAVLAMAVLGSEIRAQIPTNAERIRDSTLNEEYSAKWTAWQSRFLQFPKSEKPAVKGAPGPLICLRKEITLPAAPRQAGLTLYLRVGGLILYHEAAISSAPYWLTVNGQTLLEPPQLGFQYPGLVNLDLTKQLKAGRNVLIFKGRPTESHLTAFTAEGVVFCEDGSTIRILSDDWRGGWDLAEGWDDPAASPSLPLLAQEPNPLRGPPDAVYPRPYYGPIQVQPLAADGKAMSQPIFDEESPVALGITVLNTQGASKPGLSAELFDEIQRKILWQKTVPLAPSGKLDLTGKIESPPLPQGAYQFRCMLSAEGKELDRRIYEVATVGEIKQRLVNGKSYEDGLDLKEVWRVDCTEAPKDKESFVAGEAELRDTKDWKEVETKVVDGPAGRYRELADKKAMLFFAYRYKVKRLYVPHLAVIEWPDDARRNFIAHVVEPGSGGDYAPGIVWPAYYLSRGYQRSEGGVTTTQDLLTERSNRMQKLHLLFWPNAEEGSVHICNTMGSEQPAAAARITIYEIANDLPALKLADAGERMIGPVTERSFQTLPSTYYAGPLGSYFTTHLGSKNHPEYYHNWQTAIGNLVKRQRFSGQNAYFMTQLMYDSTLYPSRLGIFGQNTYGGGDAVGDPAPLLLRMFERNRLCVLSGMEFMTLPHLRPFRPTDEEVRAGQASPLFMITREGSLFPLHARRLGRGVYAGSGAAQGKIAMPALNYFHPDVQKSILAAVTELANTYKGYPAWKGAYLVVAECIGPMDPKFLFSAEQLWGGYEDYTVDLFAKETGIKVPVDAKDPERFEKRYQFLTGEARQKWIAWRCAKYTELFRLIRDRLTAVRSDLVLHLLLEAPSDVLAQDMMRSDNPPARCAELLKQGGFDLAALRREPGIVISHNYIVVGSGMALGEKEEWWRAETWSQSFQSLFANDAKGGAFILTGIPHYGNYNFPAKRWLFNGNATRQGYLWSTYVVESFVNVMARSNPTLMPHTWMDVCESLGRIQEMRLFARAYRSLPNGKYERLTGNGRDRNVWLASTHKGGVEYLYAANLHWWNVDVTITFAKDSQVQDLIADAPLKLEQGRCALTLGPYEIRTFRVKPAGQGGSAALESRVAEPPAAVTAIRGQQKRLADIVGKAHARESDLKSRPGWAGLAPLEKILADAKQLAAAGDWNQAYDLAFSYETEQRRGQVVCEALDAIPFLAIGPFGQKEDTNIAEFGVGNPELVKEFHGMETSFLGEQAAGGSFALQPGYHANPPAKFRVFPGEDRAWQETLLTYYLSFDSARCASEHPYWMVAYAYTEVFSPEERAAMLHAGNDHALWIWLNDAPVLRHGGYGTARQGQGPSGPDKHVVAVRLQKGWNRVLIKAVQRSGGRVFFRLADQAGNPFGDLQYRVPRA